MEVQVLKETNEAKFIDFITQRILNQREGRRREIALQLFKLLKKIPNFRPLLAKTQEETIKVSDKDGLKPLDQARIISSTWD